MIAYHYQWNARPEDIAAADDIIGEVEKGS